MNVLYDAGALIAAERGKRRIWAEHRARLELGLVPWTTAPVVAQVSHSTRQAQLHRLLRGCLVEPLRSDQAHEVGALLGRTGTTDVIDAHVVITAAQGRASVLSTDPDDMRRLADGLTVPVTVATI